MKPAPFTYFSPTTLDETLALLAEHGEAGKIIAGGQSLVPTMNFRLAQPASLIDINHVGELFFLNELPDGGLQIGAMTRQRTLEQSPLVAERCPLLAATLPYVAHVQIRNRGTIGGSLAHADPAAELPAVMVALDATFVLRSLRGVRQVPAQEFYIGLFTTELAQDELLTEIRIPARPPRHGWAMTEIARRHGDYALVGAVATVTLDGAGRCAEVRLVYFSVGDGPLASPAAAALLTGNAPTPALIQQAADAAYNEIEPLGDIHATAAYRRHLVRVLGRRVLTEAFAKAAI